MTVPCYRCGHDEAQHYDGWQCHYGIEQDVRCGCPRYCDWTASIPTKSNWELVADRIVALEQYVEKLHHRIAALEGDGDDD